MTKAMDQANMMAGAHCRTLSNMSTNIIDHSKDGARVRDVLGDSIFSALLLRTVGETPNDVVAPTQIEE